MCHQPTECGWQFVHFEDFYPVVVFHNKDETVVVTRSVMKWCTWINRVLDLFVKLVIAIVELETRFIRTQTCWMNASSSSDSLNADRGDLLVRGFWEKSTDTIIDVRVTNLDSKSYKNLSPKKALERQEKEKKKKYCKPCENQRRHFTPFVVSTDYEKVGANGVVWDLPWA